MLGWASRAWRCRDSNGQRADEVYRSTDAGRIWTNVGLANAQHIARIRVHPRDPDLVYVAVLGRPEGPHDERGMYRSRDGGRTWEQVLFRSERAGACDLSTEPENPCVLYAAIWDARRSFWESHSVGPDSCLHKTTDGGRGYLDRVDRQPGSARRNERAYWSLRITCQSGSRLDSHRGRRRRKQSTLRPLASGSVHNTTTIAKPRSAYIATRSSVNSSSGLPVGATHPRTTSREVETMTGLGKWLAS